MRPRHILALWLASILCFALASLVGTGCAGPGSSGGGGSGGGISAADREQICEAAEKAYGLYLVTVNAGLVPDDRVIAGAAAAALTLVLDCDWSPVTTAGPTSRVKGRTNNLPVDTHGVPVVAPR